jgi:hypothetical protein
MNWDSIQLAAKARGVLVYAIDQAQTVQRTQPGPWGHIYEGYCAGLCANWIAVTYQGQDFNFKDQVCDYPPYQSTLAQTIDENAGFHGWANEWQVLMAPFRCTLTALKAERPLAPSAAFICQVVYRAYGCYGVSLRRDGGGHTVAMCNGRDGRLHLFDPNYFHVAMKDPCAFQDFVGWWLQETGYGARYLQRTGVVGISPPINHVAP